MQIVPMSGTSAEPSGDAGSPVIVAPVLPFPVPPAPPYLDPAFYNPEQAVVDAAEPGQILAAREVNVANLWVFPLNVDAWQLSYRSTNTRGEAIPAVATLMKPRDTTPQGLVSFQFGEDSLSFNCSASYALQQASLPNPLNSIHQAEFIEVQGLLQAGNAVVVPDHEGPHSGYGAGPLGARIVLDGIRASEALPQARLSGAATRTAMWGYSGGAIPTAHAAELAPSYAPELNLVGSVTGGLVTNIRDVVNYNNGTSVLGGFILAALFGVSHEYPVVADYLDKHLNPLGQGLRTLKTGQCNGFQPMTFPFVNILGLFDNPDPLAAPELQAVLDELNLGHSVPAIPIYIYQSVLDEIVPPGPVNTLVDRYCADPEASVHFTRDHLSEHIVAAVAGAPSALLWIQDRLSGVPAEKGCTTNDVLTQIAQPGASTSSSASSEIAWPRCSTHLSGASPLLKGPDREFYPQ
ncbi:lipase family protein [Antrihabitans sp. YC2-6]|uniref:lipase family protein n=1 Tax=Antrihabitans sp. YC2-6 TaxID=2799498 RepID=UPI001F39D8A9|nr:lipase family protein [Antrihabitans sp. YC2-6]